MTEQHWWLLINKSHQDRELWQAFACWLQDEADQPLRAQAVLWKLNKDRWARKDSRQEIWNWINKTEEKTHNTLTWKHCLLPDCLFKELKSRKKNAGGNCFCNYRSLVSAESELLEAIEICFNKGILSPKELNCVST